MVSRRAAHHSHELRRLVRKVADRIPALAPTTPAIPPTGEGATDLGERRTADLVVRTRPDNRLRPGDRVPLLLDLDQLYVFDHKGQRICPAPAQAPRLD